MWAEVIDQIDLLHQASVPQLLINEIRIQRGDLIEGPKKKGNDNYSRQKFEQCRAKCAVWLQVIKTSRLIIDEVYDQIKKEQLKQVLHMLDTIYKVSREFNGEISARFSLWQNGFQDPDSNLPGMLEIEEESLKAYLTILFK